MKQVLSRAALHLAGIALVLSVMACAATFDNPLVVNQETITFDQKKFIQVTEHGKTLYLELKKQVPGWQAKGCFTERQIAALPAIDEAFRALDLEIQTISRRPDVKPNWELYFKALGALAGLRP